MYIVDVDSQERETEAIRHVVGTFHKVELLSPFGFDDLTFVVIEAQKPKLTPGLVGDVDILAGNLTFRNWGDYRAALAEMERKHPEYPTGLTSRLAGKMISEANGLAWPPKPVFIAGIEVKCAYFTDRLKASKSSEERVDGIRNQIEYLERMGLDRVGLLDVIGSEPAYQEDGGWLGALHRASQSMDAMSQILKDRLPPDSTSAQFVWSVGSVGGGDESIRGAGQPRMLREPKRNSRLESLVSETLAYRAALLENIPKLVADLPVPRYFPVVIIDCRKCKALHFLDDPSCSWNRRAA